MEEFSRRIDGEVLLYDGSKGAVLQSMGLEGDASAEQWNLTHPDDVRALHMAYLEAGADIIQTNTFCANSVLLGRHGLEEQLYDINYEGARLALECAAGKAMVAASIGPLGRLMEPAGDMGFEEAVALFKQQLKPLMDAGITIVNFETFMDLSELRAAVIAAGEMGVPSVIASMTFDGMRTINGNTPQSCAIACRGLGAVAVGANCSGGPESLTGPIEAMRGVTAMSLCVKPNAGMPRNVDGDIVYDLYPQDFAAYAGRFVQSGVRLIGGCCGSRPDHIAALKCELAGLEPPESGPAGDYICSAGEYALVSKGMKTAVADIKEAMPGLKTGDYYSIMDILPGDLGESDALLLHFDGMEEGVDPWQLAAHCAMFIKKPLILRTHDEASATRFLRYYCGRAGIIGTKSREGLYGALEMDEF